MPELADGMELFYCAESVRLAATWPRLLADTPDWASTKPSVHLDSVRGCDSACLQERLADKYRHLLTRADAAREMTSVWGDLAAGLARLTAAPGPVGTGTERDDESGSATDPRACSQALEGLISTIFARASRAANPDGAGSLRLWFVGESVELAHWGRYANPAANETTPQVHQEWAQGALPLAIIRDLVGKCREQFDRLHRNGGAELTRFSGDMLSRSASWGGTIPDQPADAVPSAWTAWCESIVSNEPTRVRAYLDRMLWNASSLLLARGRRLSFTG